MVNNHGIIIHKTCYKKGRRHGYDIYKKNYPVTPKKEGVNVVDLGYLGIEKGFPEQLSSTLHRKKRNLQYLSKEQKEYNQGHAQKRIVNEHTICRLKKYGIFADVFRNKWKKYDKVSDIVNYRIMNHHN
jgi:DDE superfamily endonuclease